MRYPVSRREFLTGMDREQGVQEGFAFVRRIDFDSADRSFDAAFLRY